MSFSLDQILPSLQALGLLSYWIVGAASLLEAFFLTGVVVPGTLIVDAGGVLVQRGLMDFFDLVWFAAIGSVLGGELSYWTGRLAMNRLPGRERFETSPAFARAQALFARRGGLALVIGRFLGPVAGFVSLAAGLSGMQRRKFLIWNLVGSVPYALGHVALGYFLGDALGRIGGSVTRPAVLAAVVLLALALVWGLLYSALRLLPFAWAVLLTALRNLADRPGLRQRIEARPGAARWVRARIDRSGFHGLTLTVLGLGFVIVGAAWVDSLLGYLAGGPLVQLDQRLAELVAAARSEGMVRFFAIVTATGGWQVVVPVIGAAVIWLVAKGQRVLAAALAMSAIGNTLAVSLLKAALARPRSPLGVFTESSGSFPSGHAAISVAAYGMLMYVLWRTKTLRAETALLIAGLVALAIGLSRLYLVEHYLSDVVNGWLVGALWAILGIALAEWRLAARPAAPAPLPRRARTAGLALAVVLVGVAGANVWRYDPPRNPPVQRPDRVLTGAGDLATLLALPAGTQSLLGAPLQGVSVIVLAPDGQAVDGQAPDGQAGGGALEAALRAAGWETAPAPSVGSAFDAVYTLIDDGVDPTASTLAHFWRGRPEDLALVRPTSGQDPQPARPPRARFWRTEFVTRTGLRAFVGTVDAGDRADDRGPSIGDAGGSARDALVRDLTAQGATARQPTDLAVAPNVAILTLP